MRYPDFFCLVANVGTICALIGIAHYARKKRTCPFRVCPLFGFHPFRGLEGVFSSIHLDCDNVAELDCEWLDLVFSQSLGCLPFVGGVVLLALELLDSGNLLSGCRFSVHEIGGFGGCTRIEDVETSVIVTFVGDNLVYGSFGRVSVFVGCDYRPLAPRKRRCLECPFFASLFKTIVNGIFVIVAELHVTGGTLCYVVGDKRIASLVHFD